MGRLTWLSRRLTAAGLAGFAVLARAAEPAISWHTDVQPPRVEVSGVAPAERAAWPQPGAPAAEWSRVLAVFAEQPNTANLPPMAGRWLVTKDGRLVFTPQFPLSQGVRYRAEYRRGDASPLVSSFEVPPDTAKPSTRVTALYPTANVLPENQLKFYVHFSAPMDRRHIQHDITIHDSTGRLIELPFLELEEELWDKSMTRLTLLIDPGRIKRGVKPLEDVGPVFEEGKKYTLVVSESLRDAANRPLRMAHRKEFRVGPADRTPPDPARWKIRPPPTGSAHALVVEFDEPMDHALALRVIGVTDATGKAVTGEPTLFNQERRWSFAPAKPWTAGPYRLVVATNIEDLAGNNIGKAFDVELASSAPRRVQRDSVSIDFEVR